MENSKKKNVAECHLEFYNLQKHRKWPRIIVKNKTIYVQHRMASREEFLKGYLNSTNVSKTRAQSVKGMNIQGTNNLFKTDYDYGKE